MDFQRNNKSVYSKDDIKLTYNCFINLCMQSKTENGKLVRNYFQELEKIILDYTNNNIDEMKKYIQTLEQNQKKYKII